MSKWFAVYPDSMAFDLADKNECVALFKYKDNALEFAKRYGKFYEIKELTLQELG